MESLIGVGIICLCTGGLALAALAARSAVPSYLNFDEIPTTLAPRLAFLDRHRARLLVSGAALLVLGVALTVAPR